MPQRPQIIDITKSYLPCDPNSFVHNLVSTDREDGEEKTMPVLPYEGYNFLPTAYGYKSYFGINTVLDIDVLPGKIQFVLSYQLPDYKTRLIALTADGIWICDANTSSAAWVHSVTLTDTTDVFEEWTWCIIENVLYMYRQGQANAWKTAVVTGELAIQTHTPNFLNMTGQMGIFKAGLRLGFWDSANSVSWSSNLDLTDFTPSIENLAGNSLFGDIIGRIITIRAHGEGFIIYTTRSIVGVSFSASGNLLWDSKKIFDNVGISYSRAVTFGQSDNEHIVYSTNGIYLIGKYNNLSGKHEIAPIAPDVFDFLKESRDPIYLDTINSRYVFFHILNPDYVYGLTSFTYVSPVDLNVRFQIGGHPWDGSDLPAINIDGNAAAEAIRQLVTFGFVSQNNTTALWTIITSETQDGTIGPLSTGGGTRNAEIPGFTTADIISTYIDGSTLPGELETNIFEHVNLANVYLGNLPQGSVTVDNAMGESVIQVMLKQKQDWELFTQHQNTALDNILAATKTTTVTGSTVIGYGTPPSNPTPTTEDTFIVKVKTGEGSVEIQKDAPLRKLVMRKYWQRSSSITKRKVTTLTYRSSGTIQYVWNPGTIQIDSSFSDTLLEPDLLSFSINLAAGSYADLVTAIQNYIMANAPATIEYLGTRTLSSCTVTRISNSISNIQVVYSGGVSYNSSYGVSPETWSSITTGIPYYQDSSEVLSYFETLATEDMGHVDLSATQTAHGRTIIQVTSDPATVVVHSTVPIFPTGPSAINFFPPTWNGVETLKLIAASSLSPWHLVDGTFGIELIGDPLAGATAEEDTGGFVAYGQGSIPADYGLTYSSFPYVLQVGSPFIYYPTFEGALVLDLALKKWGKMKNQYQVLIGLDPVNQFNPSILTANDTGMNAALQLIDETIKIFDEFPVDSILRYGKIGFYRKGMSNMLEVKLEHRKAVTGSLMVDSSMDGRTIDDSLRYTLPYTSARIVEGLPDISARWHIVTVSGNYDLTGLEIRATIASRR